MRVRIFFSIFLFCVVVAALTMFLVLRRHLLTLYIRELYRTMPSRIPRSIHSIMHGVSQAPNVSGV